MVNGALGRLPAAKSDYAENPFTDVDENAWYFGNVMEAAVPRGSAAPPPPDRP